MAQFDTSLYALGIKDDPNSRHKVFINYRRSDAKQTAWNIHGGLCRFFAEDDIFLDEESIGIGDFFDDVIVKTLDETAVFLAVIGPDWLTTYDGKSGQRRLDMRNDFVRREIAIALTSNMQVIPVCVEGANMPAKSDMPESIAKLADRNAYFISSKSRKEFESDVKGLIGKIQRILNSSSEVKQSE